MLLSKWFCPLNNECIIFLEAQDLPAKVTTSSSPRSPTQLPEKASKQTSSKKNKSTINLLKWSYWKCLSKIKKKKKQIRAFTTRKSQEGKFNLFPSSSKEVQLRPTASLTNHGSLEAERGKECLNFNHKKRQRETNERPNSAEHLLCALCVCVCVRVCVCVDGASYLSLCGPLNMTSCHLGSQTQGGGGSSSWLWGRQEEEK